MATDYESYLVLHIQTADDKGLYLFGTYSGSGWAAPRMEVAGVRDGAREPVLPSSFLAPSPAQLANTYSATGCVQHPAVDGQLRAGLHPSIQPSVLLVLSV